MDNPQGTKIILILLEVPQRLHVIPLFINKKGEEIVQIIIEKL